MKDPGFDENSELGKKSRWYIVHTYSGFEQRVQKTINEMIRTGQEEGLIQEVVVPTERVIELGKAGEKRTTTRKFYPGYVMVRMIMTDLSWHLVQSIPKVTGFVGGKNRWGESVPDTLKREWMEELNLEVEVKEHLLDTEFTYKETHFTLVCHKVEIIGGDIKLSVHQDYKWVDKEGLKLLDFGKSDGVIRDWIIERYKVSS